MNDQDYMRIALGLAQKGCGFTAPNPMVGAVIVKDGRLIGQGYHRAYGGLHAEREALADCSEPPAGATMYVTLEPCCHHGKQPPCTDAILEAGITRVVVGAGDPNPLVSGKGIALLRSHGVAVTEHVLEGECTRINEVFFHFIRTGQPFVAMKYAMTMDGKIAAFTGDSRWITGEAARSHVHRLRSRYTAIMAGVGTVLADDPLLTCRLDRTDSESPGSRNPVRIICDSRLRTPLTSRIVETAKEVPTILATCCEDESRHLPYLDRGCRVLVVPSARESAPQPDLSNPLPQPGLPNLLPRLDLPNLLSQLGKNNIDSILLEGGSTLNWSFLEQRLIRKVYAYIAPKLLGGQTAATPIGGTGIAAAAGALPLKNSILSRLGNDFLIESEVEADVYRDH